MRQPRFSRVVLAAVVPCLLPAATLAAELTPQEERGKVIYLEGTSPSGGEITAVIGDGGTEVPASVMPCGGCHGRDGRGRPEGGISPSNLTWPALTKPYGVEHPSGRRHPPYTERLLKRAITMGTDPAANRLHVAMPRYRLLHRDLEDLVAYIRRLGKDSDPGVTVDSITLATLLPRQGPLESLGTAIGQVLEAYFDQINRQGGIYGRRLDLRVVAAPDAAAERAAALRDHLEANDTFALVGAFMAGAEQEIGAVAEELATPLIGPFTQHPQIDFPLNPFVFYLLSGLDDLGRSMASFATSNPGTELPRAAVLARAEPRLVATAEAISNRAAELGWPAIRTVTTVDLDVEELQRSDVDCVFLLLSGERQAAFFRQAAALDWYPRVLLPGSLLGRAIFDLPFGFTDRISLAFPILPSNQSAISAGEYRDLADRYQLPTRHLTSQIATLASAHVLVEALKRSGRELSRAGLIEALESFMEFDTGLTPLVTYGPNRRVGVTGAYMVTVDLDRRTLVPASGWVGAR